MFRRYFLCRLSLLYAFHKRYLHLISSRGNYSFSLHLDCQVADLLTGAAVGDDDVGLGLEGGEVFSLKFPLSPTSIAHARFC